MLYIMHEEQFKNADSEHIQRMITRPLDGGSEGFGLAISIECEGKKTARITMDANDARDYINWCAEAIKPCRHVIAES